MPEGLGTFSAVKRRRYRSLSAGEALLSTRRLIGLGSLEYLFIEQPPITSRSGHGGGHHREEEGAGRSRIGSDRNGAAVTRCTRDLRYLWANRRYADWRNVH